MAYTKTFKVAHMVFICSYRPSGFGDELHICIYIIKLTHSTVVYKCALTILYCNWKTV